MRRAWEDDAKKALHLPHNNELSDNWTTWIIIQLCLISDSQMIGKLIGQLFFANVPCRWPLPYLFQQTEFRLQMQVILNGSLGQFLPKSSGIISLGEGLPFFHFGEDNAGTFTFHQLFFLSVECQLCSSSHQCPEGKSSSRFQHSVG